MKKLPAIQGRFLQIKDVLESYLELSIVNLVLGFVKIDCVASQFKQLRLTHEQKEEVDYQGADFEESKLLFGRYSHCSFYDAVFTSALINKVTFINCDFIQAEMSGASLSLLTSYEDFPLDFSGACLVKTRFNSVELPNAVFAYANCREADFGNANLTGAKFWRTCLIGAKLTAAKLHSTVLEKYPQIFLALLEKSITAQNLLINLLKNYIGHDSIRQTLYAVTYRQHFFPVRNILNSQPSSIEEIQQFRDWMTALRDLPSEAGSDSLTACLDFADLCSGRS